MGNIFKALRANSAAFLVSPHLPYIIEAMPKLSTVLTSSLAFIMSFFDFSQSTPNKVNPTKALCEKVFGPGDNSTDF